MAFQFTEIQERWLAALESGEYRQVKHLLVENGAYCCLGVGCVIAGAKHVEADDECGEGFLLSGRVHGEDLDRDIAMKLGLRGTTGQFLHEDFSVSPKAEGLTCLNDKCGMTFQQIAAYIRANPENVFVTPEAT